MTNPNNYTTAYFYHATHMEDHFEEEEASEPSIYDYVCEMEETPLDCESADVLDAVFTYLLMAYATGDQ